MKNHLINNLATGAQNLYVGRINRTQFFIGWVLSRGISLISIFFMPFLFPVVLLGIILGNSILVRRLHDMGVPGWYSIVPIANLILLIASFFWRGKPSENAFGAAPHSQRSVEDFLFNKTTTPADKGERWMGTLMLVILNVLLVGWVIFLWVHPPVITGIDSTSHQVVVTGAKVISFGKDITGDGVPEKFTLAEENGHGNNLYEIQRQNGDSWVDITMKGQDSKLVGFDDIEYKDGYVYATDHANDMASKTKFQLEGNILVPLMTVSFFLTPNTTNECDVRMAKDGDYAHYQVIEHLKVCNIWTESFDKYFNTTTSSGDSLIKTVLQREGMDETAIGIILKNYLSSQWYPTFLTKGDINNDSQDDYVLYVEDKDNLHKSEFDSSYNAGRMRKLVVLLSQPSSTLYQVFDSNDLAFRMECGECGGVNDPMVSASILSSTISIRERGGSPGAWWTLGADISYQNGKWIKKDFSENNTEMY